MQKERDQMTMNECVMMEWEMEKFQFPVIFQVEIFSSPKEKQKLRENLTN